MQPKNQDKSVYNIAMLISATIKSRVKKFNVMQMATYRNIFLKFVLEKKFFETFPSSLRKWCKKDINSTREVR